MDKNKLKELNAIGYKVLACCALCSNFEKGNIENSLFGTCSKHNYLHLKHEQVRNLSVSIFGNCYDFQVSRDKTDMLESFFEFMEV
jgi:hypothetical protein